MSGVGCRKCSLSTLGAAICPCTWVSAKGKGFRAQALQVTSQNGPQPALLLGGGSDTSFQKLKDQEEVFLLIPGSTAAASEGEPS